MDLGDLPIELLELIINFAIPDNWVYFTEERLVLNLRLVCSKAFIFSPFDISTAEFFVSFRIV
jgi:hypothetical protein